MDTKVLVAFGEYHLMKQMVISLEIHFSIVLKAFEQAAIRGLTSDCK